MTHSLTEQGPNSVLHVDIARGWRSPGLGSGIQNAVKLPATF
jgi:hypothetical protein